MNNKIKEIDAIIQLRDTIGYEGDLLFYIKKLEEALPDLCSNAYWYGEKTGDYDMALLHEQDFFIQVTEW